MKIENTNVGHQMVTMEITRHKRGVLVVSKVFKSTPGYEPVLETRFYVVHRQEYYKDAGTSTGTKIGEFPVA